MSKTGLLIICYPSTGVFRPAHCNHHFPPRNHPGNSRSLRTRVAKTSPFRQTWIPIRFEQRRRRQGITGVLARDFVILWMHGVAFLRSVRSTTLLANSFCPTPIFRSGPSMRYLSNGIEPHPTPTPRVSCDSFRPAPTSFDKIPQSNGARNRRRQNDFESQFC